MPVALNEPREERKNGESPSNRECRREDLFGGGVCQHIGIMFLTTFDFWPESSSITRSPVSYEFTEDYLMVGLVFLTIGYVYTIGGHVRVTDI